MFARSTIALLALCLASCVVETVPCTTPGVDPACPQIDSGIRDSGRDAPGSDTATDTNTRPDTGADGGPCARCGGATPVCVADLCVACAVDNDCVGDDRCSPTHECVACLGTAGDMCPAATPACDTTTFDCVACLTNANCTTATASVCNTTSHSCEPCNAAGECTHLTATPVCDLASMTCVDCTTATEAADCGPNSCDPATHMCTTTARSSVFRCGACAADSECASADDRCVPMEYMGTARPVGGYCLPRLGSPGCVEPYAIPSVARRSLSGAAPAVYCSINELLATCEAVLDLVNNSSCTLATECGADGLADGRCEMVGVFPNRCTYSCGTVTDCPTGKPCNAGYCGS